MRLSVPAAVLFILGCAAATSNGDRRAMSTYQQTLGRATSYDVQRYTRLILERYQYEIEQAEETDLYTMFETRWKGRLPYEDERGAGVEEARSRITVRARVQRGGEGLAPVAFTGQNLVRLADSTQWVARISPMAREHFEDVASALRTELETGIRIRR